MIFGRKKEGAPVYVCKSVSVQLLLQAGMEEAASTGLLCLMSTWIQRDFGVTGIPSAGHDCLCAVPELREAAVSSLGVNRGRGTHTGEFAACIRSPCCHLTQQHGSAWSSCAVPLCLWIRLKNSFRFWRACVCDDSAFLETARLYGCTPESF